MTPDAAQQTSAQAQPEQAQPEQTQPEQVQPEQAQPEQAQPEQTQPEQAQPEQAQPEQTQPEQTQPEQAQPEQAHTEENQPEEEELTPEQLAARQKKRRLLLHLLALFLVLDVFAAVVLIQSIHRHHQENLSVHDAQAVKLGATQDMTQEERDELIAVVLGRAHNCVTMHSEMTARNNAADIYLSNALESPCAVEMELMLMDSRETLLRTGVIDPGWYLKSAMITKPLAPGEYHCLARCLFYTTDDNAYLGTTTRQVLLTVE